MNLSRLNLAALLFTAASLTWVGVAARQKAAPAISAQKAAAANNATRQTAKQRVAAYATAASKVEQKQVSPEARTSLASDLPAVGPALQLGDAGWADRARAEVATRQQGRLSDADVKALSTEHVIRARSAKAKVGHFGATVAMSQTVGSVPVMGLSQRVVMRDDGVVTGVHGELASSESLQKAREQSFALRADEAAAAAILSVTKNGVASTGLTPEANRSGCQTPGYRCFVVEPAAALSSGSDAVATHVRSQAVFYPQRDQLVPAFYNEIETIEPDTNATTLSAVVIAADGSQATLARAPLQTTAYSYRVFANATTKVPYPNAYDPTAYPSTSSDPFQLPPSPGTAELVTADSLLSSDDLWLPASDGTLRGNNVFAYVDKAAPTGLGDGDTVVSTTGVEQFDHGYDPMLPPGENATQEASSNVNAFYVVNFLHDWFYDFGWDERARNPQMSNYGRGGAEGDPLLLETLDYSGRNNANASTPADGASPRLQFFVFDGGVTLSVAGVPTPAASATFGAVEFDLNANIGTVNPAGINDFCAPLSVDLTGLVAYVDRGSCNFGLKVTNAIAAGAVGVIIGNNTGSAPVTPGGTGPSTVPVIGVSLAAGNSIKSLLQTSPPVAAEMFKTPIGNRDSALDNTVVAHEWGHVLSNRLIGNGAGLFLNQARSMGEGWSDVVALVMAARDQDRTLPGNDSFQGRYTVGSYSVASPGGTYFGIRRLPYSTSSLSNDLSLIHMQIGEPLPSVHPVLAGGDNTEVHNAGEVWASALWEAYASLLNAYPFQDAQDRMKAYLIASLAATPLNPTFLEARDALLSAALAGDPADYTRFLQAFSKRGFGRGAQVPPNHSTDHYPVIESQRTQASMKMDMSIFNDRCDRDGILDNAEEATLSVRFTNDGLITLSPQAVTVTSSDLTFPGVSVIAVPTLAPGASVVRDIGVEGGSGSSATIDLSSDSTELDAEVSEFSKTFPMNLDVALYASSSESFDHPESTRAFKLDANGVSPWRWNEDGYMHVDDSGTLGFATLATQPITFAAGTPGLEITYRHSLEVDGADAYDGVVIEYSFDGLEWADLFDVAVVPYTHYLAGGTVLDQRPAMSGRSDSFPDFDTSTIELPSEFSGRTVLFRLMVASDSFAGAYGFDLSSLAAQGAVASGLPFSLASVDSGSCTQAPIADAGRDLFYSEFQGEPGASPRTVVSLDARGSIGFDYGLTYQWTQVAGPPVTLQSADQVVATFTTAVSRDTAFGFEVAVSGGGQTRSDRVTVVILNENVPPVIQLVAPTTADERTEVQFSAASSSDADNESLTYEWTQTAGPVVLAVANTNSSVTFTAPEVTAPTTLTFRLAVTDGFDTTEQTFDLQVAHVNRAPSLTGTIDLTVNEGELVTLSGFTATEPDGQAMTLTWTQTAGPSVTLSSTSALAPSFVAPAVTADTAFAFSLEAEDSEGQAVSLQAHVTVADGNVAPDVSNVRLIGLPRAGDTVALVVTSADPNNDALSYSWTQESGPTVGALGTTQAIAVALPSDSAGQTLRFAVTVTDSGTLTDSGSVEFVVQPAAGSGTDGASGGSTGGATGSNAGSVTGSEAGAGNGGSNAGATTGTTAKGGCQSAGDPSPFVALLVAVMWRRVRRS